jgi:hypothetical protein
LGQNQALPLAASKRRTVEATTLRTYRVKIDHVDQLGSARLGGFYCCRGLFQSARI